MKKKLQKYQGFYHRLLKNIGLFICFFIPSIMCFYLSINMTSNKTINYSEKSNLDYKVHLKQNDFYDDTYLNKDMLYIANLIDKISINFDYNFKVDEPQSINFTYDVVATLVINNVAGTKKFYEKEYILLENESMKLNNDNSIHLNETIDIDYSKYNILANKFKNSYGVDSESKLDVSMIIRKKDSKHSSLYPERTTMNMIIPLSERAVDISLDYNNIDEIKSITIENDLNIARPALLIISIILFIISTYFAIGIIKKLLLLKNKKTTYDKLISKLLKEYDRSIAETATLISFKDKETIKVSKFSELLDIHDNLQQPIIYYPIAKHQKCYFYICNKHIIYLYCIKAVDLEASDENAK